MTRWKLRSTVALALACALTLSTATSLEAAKKKSKSTSSSSSGSGDNAKISSDPDAPTRKEARLLKWDAVKPPQRGKNPEFFVRGVFVSAEPNKQDKTMYDVTILPLEVVENVHRVITEDSFANGLTASLSLNKNQLKQFQKGGVIEINQHYNVVDEGGQGHARLVAFTFLQDVQAYPVGPEAYIKKPGLDQEQYLNALKGMEMFPKVKKDEELKENLDALASSSPNATVKQLATAELASLFGAQPTGKALPKAVADSSTPTTKSKKSK